MPERTIRYDVVVAGAGPAGVAAGVSAARAGLRTLLIDPADEPGGAVISAVHTQFCGLYGDHPASVSDTLNPGLSREVARRLNEADPAFSRPRMEGRVAVLPFRREIFRTLLSDLIEGEARLDLRLRTTVQRVEVAGTRIESVELSDGDVLKVDTAIDSTGCAALAGMAGLPLLNEPESERQLAGFGLRFGAIRGELDSLRIAVPYALSEAVEAEPLPEAARFTTFVPGPDAEGVCKIAAPHTLTRDAAAFAAYTKEIDRVLRERVPALERAEILETAERAVSRDGPRLRGDAVLTRDDVLSGRTCGSGIRCAWPIEFWHPTRGPRYDWLPRGSYYEIPLDCLRTTAMENLLCAGRCISADRHAAASLRVAGMCLTLGEAAAKIVAQR